MILTIFRIKVKGHLKVKCRGHKVIMLQGHKVIVKCGGHKVIIWQGHKVIVLLYKYLTVQTFDLWPGDDPDLDL